MEINKEFKPEVKQILSAPNFQANMKRIRTNIGNYFTNKSKAAIRDITDVVTVDQYNSNYGLLDATLSNIVVSLVKECSARRAYHLGNIPTFEYGDNSLLIAKACNCAHNPVSVASKKTIRAIAEKFIMQWSKDCNEWIGKGMLTVVEKDIMDKPNKPIPVGVVKQVKNRTTNEPKVKEKPKKAYVVIKHIK